MVGVKFGGKELQDELGLDWYDITAKNGACPEQSRGNPTLGRWMSVDPLAEKYESLTLYAYAANNPLLFIDPNGKELFLSGTRSFKRKTLRNLRKLTNNRLKFNRKTGEVTIVSGKRNRSKELVVGTKLIANIIDDNNKATIMSSDDFKIKSAEKIKADGYNPENFNGNNTDPLGSEIDLDNGMGMDVNIGFDLKDNGLNIKNEDGTFGRPTEIGLAHELGHAEIFLKGMSVVETNDKSIVDPDTGKKGSLSPDELAVRSLENEIRAEQKVKLRAFPLPYFNLNFN